MSLWFLFQRGGSEEISEPRAPEPEVIAAPKAEVPERISEPDPQPEASAVAPSPAAEPTAEPTAAAPTPAASPAAAAKVSVVVHLEPSDAKLYYRGKAVGSSGVVIELDAGQRRAFEVGKPGYVTRRLVVDGSTPEVSLGLRPDPSKTP